MYIHFQVISHDVVKINFFSLCFDWCFVFINQWWRYLFIGLFIFLFHSIIIYRINWKNCQSIQFNNLKKNIKKRWMNQLKYLWKSRPIISIVVCRCSINHQSIFIIGLGKIYFFTIYVIYALIFFVLFYCKIHSTICKCNYFLI